MRANEFVKLKGIDHAETVANEWIDNYEGVDLAELKRLVASWELVEKHGGLEEAGKVTCNAYCGSNHSIPDGHEELSIAITDVESCQ